MSSRSVPVEFEQLVVVSRFAVDSNVEEEHCYLDQYL